MIEFIDVLFPALQKTLSDESDQVVQQCLVVIAEVISSQKNKSSGDNGKQMLQINIMCDTRVTYAPPFFSKFFEILILHFVSIYMTAVVNF